MAKTVFNLKVKVPKIQENWGFPYAKEKLLKKYKDVNCYSQQGGVVECTAIKPMSEETKRKLGITSNEEEADIDNLRLHYAVEPFSKKKMTEEEFIKENKLGEEPAYPYAVSSVERNMFSSGWDARMLKHGINPYKAKKVQKAIQKSLSKTPYTNWSGD